MAAFGQAVGMFVGLISSASASAKDKRAQFAASRAADIRLKQQGMANAITRRDTIRSFRMVQAQTVAAGASEDGITSSAVMGAQSSQSAQIKSNLDYFTRQASMDSAFNAENQRAGIYRQQAANWNAVAANAPAIGQLAGTIFSSLQPAPKSTPKSTG